MSTRPRRLGKYELQEILGQGGMAQVRKAFDTQLRRLVAIKFLRADLSQSGSAGATIRGNNRFLKSHSRRTTKSSQRKTSESATYLVLCLRI